MLILMLSAILMVSVIINILLYRSLIIQLKKIKLYEEWIMEYETWVEEVRNLIGNTYLRMKQVDDKNLFFKDDDVGFVFTELLTLLKNLNERIEK